MANNQINKLLEFSNLQMAAEAFLLRAPDNGVLPGDTAIQARLNEGNTHASRFTAVQAEQFITQYEVLTQYRNDPLLEGGTGFSGTLFRNRETGELTLSFRSTEFVDDSVRDGKSTNELEIKNLGWAFGQIAEMESWYAQLRADPNFLGGKTFNVTGYSLGGHLATAFNILRREAFQATGDPNPVINTYTFNGAGTGGLRGGRRLTDVLADFNRIRASYETSPEWLALPVGDRDVVRVLAQSRADKILAEQIRVNGLAGITHALDATGTPYGEQYSLEYQIAILLVGRNTIGSSNFPMPGGANWVPNAPVFASSADRFTDMTEVVGMEVAGFAPSYVSNSGVHYGARQEIYIEDQPLTRGTYFLPTALGDLVSNPDLNSFADTHSLVLLVDSLSLMALMEMLDPNITIGESRQILSAMSSAHAFTQFGSQGQADGSTLERMLDALRNLVLGSNQQPTLDYAQALQGNTWHLAEFRGNYYDNIDALKEVIGEREFTGAIAIFSVVAMSQKELVDGAHGLPDTAPEEALAYRYALKYLNPFIVIGPNSLYARHNENGELDAYNPDTNEGLTDAYLMDRAEMLVWKNLYYGKDGNVALRGGHLETYQFLDTGIRDDATRQNLALTVVGRNPLQISTPVRVIFGSDSDETLIGGDVAVGDHLYGGGGADVLRGGRGRDYLEGGVGNDTYVWDLDDDFDTILDADGIGRVVINGVVVSGGINITEGDYLSADKQFLMHYEGGDGGRGALTINGNLQIENFASGDLGITLGENGNVGDVQPTGSTFRAPFPNGTGFGTDGPDDAVVSFVDSLFIAKGGDDLVVVEDGALGPRISGGAGEDIIVGARHDPGGISELVGDAGQDIVLGGAYADQLYGDFIGFLISDYGFFGSNFNYVETDPNNPDDVPIPIGYFSSPFSQLVRDAEPLSFSGYFLALNYVLGIDDDSDLAIFYDDYLDGGGGNDMLWGGYGSDELYGGEGDDFLDGDSLNLVFSLHGGRDADWSEAIRELFGQSGDDYLDGGEGNDVLQDLNGGNDVLIGGPGGDILTSLDSMPSTTFFNHLDGGEGNDVLNLFDQSIGGSSELFGGSGNDVLMVLAGTAFLDGGSGSDTYVYRSATGKIYIDNFDDSDASDRLILSPLSGLASISSLSIARDEKNLYLGTNDIYDRVTLYNWFAGDEYKVDQIILGEWFQGGGDSAESISPMNGIFSASDIESRFITSTSEADSLWGTGADDTLDGGAGDDSLFGGDGQDLLIGGDGSDNLTGGSGNDWLEGGTGDDTYLIELGDGADYIEDAQGSDTVRFGDGIGAESITVTRNDEELVLQLGAGQLRIRWLPEQDYRIDKLQFANGTEWDASTLESMIGEQPIASDAGEVPPLQLPKDEIPEPQESESATPVPGSGSESTSGRLPSEVHKVPAAGLFDFDASDASVGHPAVTANLVSPNPVVESDLSSSGSRRVDSLGETQSSEDRQLLVDSWFHAAHGEMPGETNAHGNFVGVSRFVDRLADTKAHQAIEASWRKTWTLLDLHMARHETENLGGEMPANLFDIDTSGFDVIPEASMVGRSLPRIASGHYLQRMEGLGEGFARLSS